MSLIKKIFDWAKTTPEWQQDAFRRLFEKSNLSNDDKNEIFQNLKKANGIDSEDESKLISLEEDHIPSFDDPSKKIVLKRIHTIKNANRLKEDESIVFNESGITIIYGPNGSGKSGYARILKRACRARDAGGNILPNLFSTDHTITPSVASAIFDLTMNGNLVSESWIDDQIPPSILSKIAVFDSACARVYVNEKNDVDYLPYGADILLKLVECFEELRLRIKHETPFLRDLPYDFTELVSQTSLDPLIKKLKNPEILVQILELGKLNENELERILELEKSIEQRKVSSPRILADKFARKKSRYSNLRDELKSIANQLGSDKVNIIRSISEKLINAKAAAKLASHEKFADEPLLGTGSDTWKELFLAAKKYSEELAYAEKVFPCTESESRCVLCQQLLEDDAKQRFKKFDDFIKDETAKIVEKFQVELDSSLKTLEKLNFECFNTSLEVEEEIKSEQSELHKEILIFLANAKKLYSFINEAVKDNTWEDLPVLNTSLVFIKIERYIDDFQKKIDENLNAQFEPQTAYPEDNEYKELKARQLINKYEKEITQYSHTRQTINKFNDCYNVLDTTRITKKQTSLLNDTVTVNLFHSLKKELEDLGVDEIRLALVPSGTKGKLNYRIILEGIKGVNPSDVLSEGEERIVAIASFLAELSENSHSSGIVFDDPVSSLDHRWRDKVAERLIKEAKNRQVIVFTHDLVFLLALDKQGEWNNLASEDILIQSIESNKSHSGLLIPNPPYTSKTKSQIGALKQMQQKAQSLFKQGGSIYDPFVERVYSKLRASWEQAIEEILLNETVLRFRYGVETKRLKDVIGTINDVDYDVIEKAMAKCSEVTDAHNTAPAAYGSMPSPEDLESDIKILESFVEEIKKRRK